MCIILDGLNKSANLNTKCYFQDMGILKLIAIIKASNSSPDLESEQLDTFTHNIPVEVPITILSLVQHNEVASFRLLVRVSASEG